MAQKIRADHPKGVLGDVPGQPRQRRGKRQRVYRDASVVGDAATLETVGREVVRIASAPRGLGVRPPGDLACRLRAGPLPSPDVRVGDEPAATDPARSFPAHAPMLRAAWSVSSGPFLASRPGSIFASAEGQKVWRAAASRIRETNGGAPTNANGRCHVSSTHSFSIRRRCRCCISKCG